MRLVELVGGDPPSAWLEGSVEEIRALSRLLGRDVVVVSAHHLDVAPEALLARVNGARIRGAMSWRQVGTQAGVASSTLSRWATGRGLPSARSLAAVARWLEAQADGGAA